MVASNTPKLALVKPDVITDLVLLQQINDNMDKIDAYATTTDAALLAGGVSSGVAGVASALPDTYPVGISYKTIEADTTWPDGVGTGTVITERLVDTRIMQLYRPNPVAGSAIVTQIYMRKAVSVAAWGPWENPGGTKPRRILENISGQSLATGVSTDVNWTSAVGDLGNGAANGMSYAAGVVTLARAGLYRITVQTTFAPNVTGVRNTLIIKGGTAGAGVLFGTQEVAEIGGYQHMQTTSIDVYLIAGTTIKVQARQSSGGALVLDSPTLWSIVLDSVA